jgi:hypothetical protein
MIVNFMDKSGNYYRVSQNAPDPEGKKAQITVFALNKLHDRSGYPIGQVFFKNDEAFYVMFQDTTDYILEGGKVIDRLKSPKLPRPDASKDADRVEPF